MMQFFRFCNGHTKLLSCIYVPKIICTITICTVKQTEQWCHIWFVKLLVCCAQVCQPDGRSVIGSPRGSAHGGCGRHNSYDDGNGYEHLISMPCTTKCSMRCTAMPTCRPARTSDTHGQLQGSCQGSQGSKLENLCCWRTVQILYTSLCRCPPLEYYEQEYVSMPLIDYCFVDVEL
jgi:hypothetical protein